METLFDDEKNDEKVQIMADLNDEMVDFDQAVSSDRFLKSEKESALVQGGLSLRDKAGSQIIAGRSVEVAGGNVELTDFGTVTDASPREATGRKQKKTMDLREYWEYERACEIEARLAQSNVERENFKMEIECRREELKLKEHQLQEESAARERQYNLDVRRLDAQMQEMKDRSKNSKLELQLRIKEMDQKMVLQMKEMEMRLGLHGKKGKED